VRLLEKKPPPGGFRWLRSIAYVYAERKACRSPTVHLEYFMKDKRGRVEPY
jgi:hypothetical protein